MALGTPTIFIICALTVMAPPKGSFADDLPTTWIALCPVRGGRRQSETSVPNCTSWGWKIGQYL